jgi:RimJ/RimL family protein N-acetyltransferase
VLPELVTDRLVLRPPVAGDLARIVALHGDPLVMAWIDDGRPVSADLVVSRDFGWLSADHGDGRGYWIGVERATDVTVGWFGLRPEPGRLDVLELGYRLRPTCWGRGLATEGARALLAHAFDTLRVSRVFATTMVVNVGSWRVMEKIGLRHRRTFRYAGPDPLPGAEHGDVEYTLTLEEWRGPGALAAEGGQPEERGDHVVVDPVGDDQQADEGTEAPTAPT